MFEVCGGELCASYKVARKNVRANCGHESTKGQLLLFIRFRTACMDSLKKGVTLSNDFIRAVEPREIQLLKKFDLQIIRACGVNVETSQRSKQLFVTSFLALILVCQPFVPLICEPSDHGTKQWH